MHSKHAVDLQNITNGDTMAKIISGYEVNDCEDWVINRLVYVRASKKMDYIRSQALIKIIENIDSLSRKVSISKVDVRRHPSTLNKKNFEIVLISGRAIF